MSEKSEEKFNAFRKELAALCIKHAVTLEGMAEDGNGMCQVVVGDLTDEHADVFPHGIEDGCCDE